MANHEIAILISLFSLGFFGGFSHCTGMCGPFVLMQVNQRLENINIIKLTEFKKLTGIALLPYHLGRITTYSMIGFCSSFLAYNLKELSGFRYLSAILLIIAGIIFIITATVKIKLPFKINFIKNRPSFYFGKITSFLFKNPQGVSGYLLGIVLGFLPCGFLYGALSLTTSLENHLVAALGMTIFGIATIPSLFLTACGSQLFFYKLNLKLLARIVLLINGLTLFVIVIGLILNRV